MARTAINAGFDVVVYSRTQRGLPETERRDGYVVRRAPWRAWMAVPGVSRLLGYRIRKRGPRGTPTRAASPTLTPTDSNPPAATAGVSARHDGRGPIAPSRTRRSRVGRIVDRVLAPELIRTLLGFPVRPIAWSRSLERIVEPADIWHGMWAGSLPALVASADRLGGRTIYDSRDVYMESRRFAVAAVPVRQALRHLERRWAQRADRVITVNDSYATLIERQLGVSRPSVVRNVPACWTPPTAPQQQIRDALGLPASTAVVLYQGQLITDRGIEASMEAILEVDNPVLLPLGRGPLRRAIEQQVVTAPYRGKVFLLPPVAPDELLAWTASADVSVMAIAPTSINHRFTTPQKLFESIAVGVPVVASDLPGMAEVVRDANAGCLCDPLSPTSIAQAIRSLVNESPADRAARRARLLAVAHDRYAWDNEASKLVALYEDLLSSGSRVAPG